MDLVSTTQTNRAARDRRYNTSEKGRARHARYNASQRGRDRWNRYEEGSVGTEHRYAEYRRRLEGSLDGRYDQLDALRAEIGLGPSERRVLPEYVPDYNKARKLDALCARRRDLGWDFKFVHDGGIAARLILVPVRDDAVPPRVIEEVSALWRMSGTENFTRRVRRS